jgi:anti-sigma-K factor RskA
VSGGRIARGDGACGGNAAPYVLGALPAAESEAFVTHLAECAVCREEVAALRTAAAALPSAAPQFKAPPELRRRVLAAVDAEARVPSGAGAERPVARRPALRRSRAGGPARAWRPVAAGAAALAAVALALVLVLGGSGAKPRVVRAAVTAPGAAAIVRIHGDRAELRMTHMPQVPAGRVYEVWLKRGGAPVPTDALFTVSADGSASVGIPGSVRGVRELMVTSERLGGSSVPTRSPVLIARL